MTKLRPMVQQCVRVESRGHVRLDGFGSGVNQRHCGAEEGRPEGPGFVYRKWLQNVFLHKV